MRIIARANVLQGKNRLAPAILTFNGIASAVVDPELLQEAQQGNAIAEHDPGWTLSMAKVFLKTVKERRSGAG